MRVRSFLQNMMKEKKIFYGLLFPVLFSGIAGATGLLLWHILPFYADDPLEILQKVTPVKCYYDRNMSLVKRERSRQYQWRIPLPLSRISPEAVKVILAAEDANFYKHDGVDLSAILRAAYQNISSGRIISGASTIPMQLAALAMRENKIPRRTVTGKIQQALMARKLVRLYPKQRILEEYLNRIPFGGSIYGIEAAAVYYFGLPAEKLNIAEASLLCGIPQRPGVYRPDKALPLARERQKRVLQMLEKRQIIQKGEWEKIFNDSPLRLRDFSFPSRLAGKEPFIHNMYFRQAVRELAKTERNVPFEIHTALDQEMTGAALDTLKKYASFHPDIKDGAAVLICNRTMEVLVYIGTLDAKEPFTGQVDAAAAVRSAGSTLKPFLYGEGINGGMVSPDTFFHDEPLRYKDYEPANFDGKFRGKVTLEEALQLSLNTTAVKMLEMLGEQRALNLFAALGLRPRSTRKNGLSLALGSAGHTLLELTNAFTVIPNNGVFQKATFLKRESPEKWKENTKRMIWTENTAAALRSVLQRKVPPFGELDAAWKTGTSNGNKDAWCLAATPEYTLGVWFGNKDGKSSPHLVGISLAAPCAAGILESLYRNGKSPVWKESLSVFEEEKLCVETALKATSACPGVFSGRKVKGIPLKSCTNFPAGKGATVLRLLSPKSGNYLLAKGETSVSIPLLAPEKDILWFIDGVMLKKIPSFFSFQEGTHKVSIVHPHGRKRTQSITFQVIRKD